MQVKKGKRETLSEEQSSMTAEEGSMSEGAVEERERLCLEENWRKGKRI